MKRIVMATAVLAVATGPVCAQQSTAVGVGQAKSTSISAARSTAIGVGGTAVPALPSQTNSSIDSGRWP